MMPDFWGATSGQLNTEGIGLLVAQAALNLKGKTGEVIYCAENKDYLDSIYAVAKSCGAKNIAIAKGREYDIWCIVVR
jgi:hypothetical protein